MSPMRHTVGRMLGPPVHVPGIALRPRRPVPLDELQGILRRTGHRNGSAVDLPPYAATTTFMAEVHLGHVRMAYCRAAVPSRIGRDPPACFAHRPTDPAHAPYGWCCRACGRPVHRQSQRSEPVRVRPKQSECICAACGALFIAFSTRARTCTEACRKRLSRQEQRRDTRHPGGSASRTRTSAQHRACSLRPPIADFDDAPSGVPIAASRVDEMARYPIICMSREVTPCSKPLP